MQIVKKEAKKQDKYAIKKPDSLRVFSIFCEVSTRGKGAGARNWPLIMAGIGIENPDLVPFLYNFTWYDDWV